MKKYISADLRVINCANDIIATSGDPVGLNGYEDGEGLVGGRRGWDEF